MRRLLPMPLLVAAVLVAAAVPSAAGRAVVGTSLDPALVPENSVIPLRGERPSWYTPDLQAEVDAAGGVLSAPLDVPLPSEVGIRPGSWMLRPHGCTMNFVFQKNGAFAIGTAGHCVDKIGQEVTLLTLAPGAGNPVLVNIGEVIARHDNGVGDDFALVSIRPELNEWVFPTTAAVGGPCGAYTGDGYLSTSDLDPETVWHYGHGLAIGTGGTPRSGVAIRFDADAFYWGSPSIFGDSGSPVRVTDLQAAGNLTHLVVSKRILPAGVAGTRITKMLGIAKGWSLVNSPLCVDTPLVTP